MSHAATRTIEAPASETRTEYDHGWTVILWNDDHHSFDEVIFQVQRATGCTLEDAIAITFEAHTEGKAACYAGMLERCEMVAAILRQIKLGVTIERI